MSVTQEADRDWFTGDDNTTGSCPDALDADARAPGANIIRRHPLEPSCWVIMNDTSNLIVPKGARAAGGVRAVLTRAQ